jgi:hypothetical protein
MVDPSGRAIGHGVILKRSNPVPGPAFAEKQE